MVCSECGGGEDDADIRELLHQGEEPGLAHHGTVPGAEGLGELSGQLELGANIMVRLGAVDNIFWSPEAEVSVPEWPVAMVIWRLVCQCIAHSQCCGGHTRRWGSILRPPQWRDDILGLLEAEADMWRVLEAEGSVWSLLEAGANICWPLGADNNVRRTCGGRRGHFRCQGRSQSW